MWYTIKPGESLSTIAQKYLGSLMLFNEIYEANKDVLFDPDIVYAGTKIWIPVGGKAKPSNVISDVQTTTKEVQEGSPYRNTFVDSSMMVESSKPPQSVFSTVDMNKVMIYGGVGLVALAALTLIV